MSRIRNVKEFAELCGVSTATVSRALSGTGRVGADTRKRILALADKLGYEPNHVARNLRTQKTMTVGVIVPLGHDTGQHLSDPFFNTMTGFLADGLAEQGYDLLLSRVIPRGPDWLQRFVGSGKVDGVIVIGQSDQAGAIEDLARHYAPMVVWGQQTPGQSSCTVGSDNHAGGMLAARHLIERGCRRLAFVGPVNIPEFGARHAGASQAAIEAGVADSLVVLPSHLEPDAAHADLSATLRGLPELPDGLIAGSDVTAISALRALAEMGVRVPGEVRVIGYDGLPIGAYIDPPLTTIDQQLQSGARHLVELLLQRIAGETPGSVLIEPRLIVRGTS